MDHVVAKQIPHRGLTMTNQHLNPRPGQSNHWVGIKGVNRARAYGEGHFRGIRPSNHNRCERLVGVDAVVLALGAACALRSLEIAFVLCFCAGSA